MQWKFRALWAPLRGCAMIHQHWCHNSPNERKSPPAGRRRKAAALPTNETDCPVSRLRARLNCPVLNNQPFVPGLCPAAFIPGVPAAEAALAMRHHYVCWLQHFMRGWPAAAAGAQTLHAATLPRAQFSIVASGKQSTTGTKEGWPSGRSSGTAQQFPDAACCLSECPWTCIKVCRCSSNRHTAARLQLASRLQSLLKQRENVKTGALKCEVQHAAVQQYIGSWPPGAGPAQTCLVHSSQP